jgi:membrane-associated HD superfamily phosphohydrolase
MSQTKSITLISPGTEVTISPADHWRYTVPRLQMQRIAYHLERAKGCIEDYKLYKELVDSMSAQITTYKLAAELTEDLPQQINEIIETRKQLTRKQRTAQWFRNRWKDFVAFILGAIAAAEAAFIVYQTVNQ